MENVFIFAVIIQSTIMKKYLQPKIRQIQLADDALLMAASTKADEALSGMALGLPGTVPEALSSAFPQAKRDNYHFFE